MSFVVIRINASYLNIFMASNLIKVSLKILMEIPLVSHLRLLFYHLYLSPSVFIFSISPFFNILEASIVLLL